MTGLGRLGAKPTKDQRPLGERMANEATSSIRIDKIREITKSESEDLPHGTQKRIDSRMEDPAADRHDERPDDSEARERPRGQHAHDSSRSGGTSGGWLSR